jgi:hypothetical protein
MTRLFLIPLMLILGGWASQDTHAERRLQERERDRPTFERTLDQELIDWNRLYEFYIEQQHRERELRCQKRSIRYRCPEAYE